MKGGLRRKLLEKCMFINVQRKGGGGQGGDNLFLDPPIKLIHMYHKNMFMQFFTIISVCTQNFKHYKSI